MHDARRMADACALSRAARELAHTCMHILTCKGFTTHYPGARARACVRERCVKWANLYLSDIEYSYRGAVGTDKSVYSVRCVLTAPVIVPLGVWTTGLSVCIWVG